MPHVIRLHGPWQAGDGDAAVRCDWPEQVERAVVEPDAHGIVVLRRAFGRPLNLNRTDRIWLVLEQARPGVELRLNGELLATTTSAGDVRCDVTAALQPRNELSLKYTAAGQETWPAAAVRLEFNER